jgi:hypothetical protein
MLRLRMYVGGRIEQSTTGSKGVTSQDAERFLSQSYTVGYGGL